MLEKAKAQMAQAQAQVTQTRAQVARREAAAEHAGANFEKAQSDYDRVTSLYQKDIKAVSKLITQTLSSRRYRNRPRQRIGYHSVRRVGLIRRFCEELSPCLSIRQVAL